MESSSGPATSSPAGPETWSLVERREPGLVLLFSLFSCGLYLVYWYYRVYEEFEQLTGQSPTGQVFWVDLVLSVLSCGLYGIWVDYRIAFGLRELESQHGAAQPQDTTVVTIILDVAAYMTGFLTNLLSSALHQDQLNRVAARLRGTLLQPPAVQRPDVHPLDS